MISPSRSEGTRGECECRGQVTHYSTSTPLTATLFHSDLFGSVPILIKASGQLCLLVFAEEIACVCRGLEGWGRGGWPMSSLFGLWTAVITVANSELYFNFLHQLLLQSIKLDGLKCYLYYMSN